MKPTLTIIGGGMGDIRLLTAAASTAIAAAKRIYAPPRLEEMLRPLNPGVQSASTTEICAALKENIADATVVVSGDAGFYSLSSVLGRELGEAYSIRTINGLSSLQYLCAQVGKPYDDAQIISLHGRSGSIIGPVNYSGRTFILTGGENTATSIIEQLCEAGLGNVTVTVGENLSASDERITTASLAELRPHNFSELAVMLVENPAPVSPNIRLRDEDFIRGDTPMTKEAIRVLSVARLEIQPTDTVWDIGAGTGSVSVALCYAARRGMVYAVERDPDALTLIRRNREALGARNMVVVAAEAPDGLAGLPPADKVFLGGTGGKIEPILALLTRSDRAVTVCINAITLESVAEALHCLDSLGFADVQVQSVNVAEAKTAGGYRMMMAQNPVQIISGRWQP